MAPVNTEFTEERVVLVDEHDTDVGTGEKLAVHQSGALHRAFSVFVRDQSGRLLLQRRATTKYHSPGLWSNTCCGHPRPGEETADAANRRLREEMGFTCPLRHVGSFTYRAVLGNGLVEHELDHVFAGTFNGEPTPHPSEASAYRWITLGDLEQEMAGAPEKFTAWLKPALTCLQSAESILE